MPNIEGEAVAAAADTRIERVVREHGDGSTDEGVIVHRADLVYVMPLRRNDRNRIEVMLVTGERPAVGAWSMVELLSGPVDAGETAEDAARRILEAKGRLRTTRVKLLAERLAPSPEILSTKASVVLAGGLRSMPDRTDGLSQGAWVPLADTLTHHRTITHMPTLVAVLLVELHERAAILEIV